MRRNPQVAVTVWPATYSDQFKYLGIAAVFEVVSGHGSTRIAMGITGRDAGSF
jgi:hypothetical protein